MCLRKDLAKVILIFFFLPASALAEPQDSSVETLIVQLNVQDTDKRVSAIKSLGALREKARPALPALIRIANEEDPFLAHEAESAVNLIGLPNAQDVENSIQNLLSNDERIKKDALSLLRAATTIEAKQALKEFSRTNLSWLIEQSRSQNEISDRRFSIYLIGTLWNEAAPAVPALQQALHDKSPDVRKVALAVLGRIGPAAQPVAPDLVRILEGNYEYDMCKQCAAYALGKMKANIGVPALTKALQSDEPAIRLSALESLGQIGISTQAVISAIAKIPATEEEDRLTAKRALKSINSPESLQLLAKFEEQEASPLWEKLHDFSIHYGNTMEPLLKKIGSSAKSAVPFLIKALDDKNERVQARALSMLARIPDVFIDRDPSPLLSQLAKFLQAPSMDVRKAASAIAGAIGPRAARLSPILKKLIFERDACHPCAIQALVKIEPENSISTLLEVAASPQPEDSQAALEALKLVSPLPKDKIVPLLKWLIQNPDEGHRINGFAAIAFFNLASEFPELKYALADPEPRVRRNAAAAVLLSPELCRAYEEEMIALSRQNNEPETQQTAAAALGRFGSMKAFSDLRKLMYSSTQQTSINALLGIFRLSSVGDPNVKIAEDYLLERGVQYRKDFILSLVLLETIPDSMLPFIDSSLGDEDFWVRVLAGEAIASRKLGSLYEHATDSLFDVGMRAMESNVEPLFHRAKAALTSIPNSRAQSSLSFLVPY